MPRRPSPISSIRSGARHVDRTFSRNDVDALPVAVVEEVVGVSNCGRPREDGAGIRIDNEQSRRQTARQRDPVMLLSSLLSFDYGS